MDVEAYAQGQNSCQRATTSFMGGTPQQLPAEYAQANVLNTTLNGEITILAGELDNLVPLTESPLPAARFEQVPGAGHFDWLHPGTPAFARFVELIKNK